MSLTLSERPDLLSLKGDALYDAVLSRVQEGERLRPEVSRERLRSPADPLLYDDSERG